MKINIKERKEYCIKNIVDGCKKCQKNKAKDKFRWYINIKTPEKENFTTNQSITKKVNIEIIIKTILTIQFIIIIILRI